ncbi:TerC family protein [Planctopirus hydrillae]|uniref:Tellurium resistance protein TerC n=1 Tax=Planctopirus hydrillae TaxID=1841610 RepID=A0A1C3E9P4_9PLAN|nr:TerC family protein [Planctopirus hydrillae]ODA29943.1 tellurium resistance protein TerC [Planctopirus hydrillae]
MTVLVWAGFIILVLLILAFDLGAFSRGSHRVISARQALFRTGVYFALSCLFTVFVYYAYENHWFELGRWETSTPAAAANPESSSEKAVTTTSTEATASVENSTADKNTAATPPEAGQLTDGQPAGGQSTDAHPTDAHSTSAESSPAHSNSSGHAKHHRFEIAFPFEPSASSGDSDEEPTGLPENGSEAAIMYFTGYLVEQSLSMDNIFVIALILSFFQVPAAYQHRVLFWGIIGALVMRGVMIALGAAIIQRFDWVIYIFGALLIYTAVKMLFAHDEELDLEQNRLVKFIRRIIPVYPGFVGDHFFTKLDGKLAVTPLFVALMMVESTDLLFAVDSIPAVFGITQDPFLVFSSNVFAILGLRSLYFALVDLLDRFRFLKYSLVAILFFVGSKMLAHHYIVFSPFVSLFVIAIFLGLGIGASFVVPAPPHEEKVEPAQEPS